MTEMGAQSLSLKFPLFCGVVAGCKNTNGVAVVLEGGPRKEGTLLVLPRCCEVTVRSPYDHHV